MALAARVLGVAAPELAAAPLGAARAATRLGSWRCARRPSRWRRAWWPLIAEELAEVGAGNVAVICPRLAGRRRGRRRSSAAGIDHGRANRHGLDQQVTVVPVGLVKGLELDAAVVVEPAAIVDEEAQGLRALYVALTRATKRLAVAHARPLPAALAG